MGDGTGVQCREIRVQLEHFARRKLLPREGRDGKQGRETGDAKPADKNPTLEVFRKDLSAVPKDEADGNCCEEPDSRLKMTVDSEKSCGASTLITFAAGLIAFDAARSRPKTRAKIFFMQMGI